MASFSISCYAIRIRKKYKRKGSTYCTLDHYDDGHDLYNTLWSFLQKFKVSYSHDSSARRVMKAEILKRDDAARTIEGIVRTGEYGFEAHLTDADSGKVSYTRKVREAEVLPFYFLASIPSGTDEGILLLQRFNLFGIRRFFFKRFIDYFRDQHEGYSLTISPLIERSIIEKLRTGKLESIRVIKYTLPNDVADSLRIPHEEVEAEYVIRAKSRSGNALRDLRNRIFEQSNYRIAELDELVHDFDTVKVDMEIEDGRRRIDLSKPKLRMVFDITDRLDIQKTGHPSNESLRREARKLLQEVQKKITGG